MADETRPLTVIGVHWIDHLDNEGRIAKCKPHDFKFEDEWLALYTRAGVTRHVSGLSSLLNTQGDSPLIAVIPPDMLFQSEREYVIHQLHEANCLFSGDRLLWQKSAEADSVLPILRGNERKYCYRL